MVINSNEKTEEKKREENKIKKRQQKKKGRGTLNRQTAVTIETGKLYPNCQNLISSVSFSYRRDEGEVNILTQNKH